MNGSPILYVSPSSDGHMGVSAPDNRKKYFAKIGVNEKGVVDIVVSHTENIKIADKSDAGKFFEGYDAVITKDKDIILGLTVADCIPIALFDPVIGVRALVHAGWRGLDNGIIGKTVKLMSEKFSVKSGNLEVYIGPHICQKHYEIKADVSDKFAGFPQAVKHSRGKSFLDLGLVAKIQLKKMGVKEANINNDPICNFENKNLFSYRRGDIKSRNLYLFTGKY